MENYYELLYMKRMGDEWAEKTLLKQVEPIIHGEVSRALSRFSRLEIYRDDFLQEGMIALEQAVDCFREDLQASFPTFLTLVVRRRIYSQIRHFSAKSYVQIHETVSMDNLVSESEGSYDVFGDPDPMSDPQYSFYYNEAKERFERLVENMTDSEREILRVWRDDISYREACTNLGISYKTFDGRMHLNFQ